MEDVYVYTYPLPGIRELARRNEDGTITVLVDSALSVEQQMEAVNHALSHVIGDDWSKVDVQVIEANAHAPRTGQIAPILRFSRSDEEIPVLAPKTRN